MINHKHLIRKFSTFQGCKIKQSLNILGVKDGATEVDVKQAYFKLAKQCHPDVTKGH